MRHARGLTLVELMVVVAVAALLLAIAAPSFRGLVEMQRLRSVNAALTTDIAYARSEAVSRSQLVRVEFNAANGTLTCYVVFVGNPLSCDCTQTPACLPAAAPVTREIRTVRVRRDLGVAIALPTEQPEWFEFDPVTGGIRVYTLDTGLPVVQPFVVAVNGQRRGALRTTVNPAGRSDVCSPDASVSGVPSC